MTKEEFTKIVNKFNEDKIKYNWLKALSFTKNYRWKNFKKMLDNFPEYYNFLDAMEFKYWLMHSEDCDFIDKRFCPICGKFIEKSPNHKQFIGYYLGCPEHRETLRMDKVKIGFLEKYGTRNIHAIPEIKEKIEATNMKKYGVAYPLQSADIHKKTIASGNAKGSYKIGALKVKATCLEKYGDENYNNSKSISASKLSWSPERKNLYATRCKQTKLEHYGDENYNNREKTVATCLEKYGVDNVAKLPEIKEKAAINATLSKIKNHTTTSELMQNEEYRNNYVKKCRETKHKNGTFNTSKSFEDQLIDYLKETYPQYTIITQYYDDQCYPYNCDCYIKELDLFIEFQGSYFHNWRPFDNSEAHIQEYNNLIAKGGLSATVADTWRYRDVEKRKVAKENNLNYLEYWENLILLPEDIRDNMNNLVLYYQQNLFYEDAKIELYDPIKRWKYYQNAVKYSDFYKKYGYVSHLTLLRRPYISKLIGFSSFNIKLCEIIDKKYTVYDPCGGWGHRMLGFKNHKGYIYNDINSKCEINCMKMAKKENIMNVEFYNQDAIIPINNEYDVVFTCPPYFNKELFTEEGAENYTEEEFIRWWNAVLNNLHPTTGEIYIVINSNYLKYFTTNDYKYEIISDSLRKSHYHKSSKTAKEIVVKFIKAI